MTDLAAVARRALPLLDLTSLNDDDTPERIAALCDRAAGKVAAICIYPRFVAAARRRLDPAVALATVVNFPSGAEPPAQVLAMTRAALADGADEIDLVLPYERLMAGDSAGATAMVAETRAEMPPGTRLKVILETGRLADAVLIRAACAAALAGGADFLKTSTGKVAPAATLEAAEVMLTAIAAAPRPVGFKAAGGIRTTAEAARYLALADRIMGPGWVGPATFRFGASGLLDDLLATLGHGGAPTLSGY